MNRKQKILCFNLLVACFSLATSIGTVILLAKLIGMPKAWGGMFVMLSMGFMSLGPFIFRDKNDEDTVPYDERDLLIYKRSELAAFCATYGFFITFCSIVLNKVGIYGQVHGYMFLLMLGGGIVVLLFAKALALIILYSQTSKGEKS
jgi:hypothetical protein